MATASPLLLDITRSVKRARLGHATGIDRVERRYLDWALGRPDGAFLLCRIGGAVHLIAPDRAERVASGLTGIERGEAPPLDIRASLQRWRSRPWRAAEALVRRNGRASIAPSRLGGALAAQLPSGTAALNVGHDHLVAGLAGALRRGGAKSLTMLHDLIPLTHPEFARPGSDAPFRARLEAALEADHLLYNSAATADAVASHLARCGRTPPPGTVLPLGLDPQHAPQRAARLGPAQFVVLGTIEGRKNHLLLLSIWRRFWERLGAAGSPHLHVVGRRGWAAEQALALLDRAPMMGHTVFEHSARDDAAVTDLLARADALLFPSLAEGYGLPLGEALALGVPVIASDLPALRELGQGVPDYLDPLDGTGWLAAIEDYAEQPPSPRRLAQAKRLAVWQRPCWAAHFAALEDLVGGAAEQPVRAAGRSPRPRVRCG
ncbi:MAG: glycosyltransferase [Pseudomonadota bacterium]